MQKITPCLWFDTEGEEAAQFYTSVFPNSRILDVTRFGSAGPGPLLADPDREKSQRVMSAMLGMGKLEIEALEQA